MKKVKEGGFRCEADTLKEGGLCCDAVTLNGEIVGNYPFLYYSNYVLAKRVKPIPINYTNTLRIG